MAQADDLVVKTLLEIKEDIGGLSSDVKSVKDSLVKNDHNHEIVQGQIRRLEVSVGLIPGHIQAVRDMEVRMDDRIGKIESDVKYIKETDFPALKEQLVVHKWLRSGRNKIIALVSVGLLGALGNALAGLVKDNVKVSIVPSGPILAPVAATPSTSWDSTSGNRAVMVKDAAP